MRHMTRSLHPRQGEGNERPEGVRASEVGQVHLRPTNVSAQPDAAAALRFFHKVDNTVYIPYLGGKPRLTIGSCAFHQLKEGLCRAS